MSQVHGSAITHDGSAFSPETARRAFAGRFGRKKIAQSLEALEAEWYRKLADTGFQDIEVYNDPSNTYLRGHHIEARKRQIRGTEGGVAEYMRLAEELLEIDPWKTRTERWTFAAWCKGGWDYRELACRWPAVTKTAATLRVHFKARMKKGLALFTSRLDEGNADG